MICGMCDSIVLPEDTVECTECDEQICTECVKFITENTVLSTPLCYNCIGKQIGFKKRKRDY